MRIDSVLVFWRWIIVAWCGSPICRGRRTAQCILSLKMWSDFLEYWLGLSSSFFLIFIMYSLISMRPIYYFDTWAIIWHGIVCWFMVFTPFFPVLVFYDHEIVLHWYENQNKNNLVIMLHKSWKILGNLQKSTNNFAEEEELHNVFYHQRCGEIT